MIRRVEIYEMKYKSLRLVRSRLLDISGIEEVRDIDDRYEKLRNIFNKEGCNVAMNVKANKYFVIYKYENLSDTYKALYKLDEWVLVNHICEVIKEICYGKK